MLCLPGSFPPWWDQWHRSIRWTGRPCWGHSSGVSRSRGRNAGGRSASLGRQETNDINENIQNQVKPTCRKWRKQSWTFLSSSYGAGESGVKCWGSRFVCSPPPGVRERLHQSLPAAPHVRLMQFTSAAHQRTLQRATVFMLMLWIQPFAQWSLCERGAAAAWRCSAHGSEWTVPSWIQRNRDSAGDAAAEATSPERVQSPGGQHVERVWVKQGGCVRNPLRGLTQEGAGAADEAEEAAFRRQRSTFTEKKTEQRRVSVGRPPGSVDKGQSGSRSVQIGSITSGFHSPAGNALCKRIKTVCVCWSENCASVFPPGEAARLGNDWGGDSLGGRGQNDTERFICRSKLHWKPWKLRRRKRRDWRFDLLHLERREWRHVLTPGGNPELHLFQRLDIRNVRLREKPHNCRHVNENCFTGVSTNQKVGGSMPCCVLGQDTVCIYVINSSIHFKNYV